MSDQFPASPGPPAPLEPGARDPAAVAAYIADMVATLSAMARRQKFDALGYLLEMARLEAEALSNIGQQRPLD